MSSATIQFDFGQKRVLITGGTSGMGEACAVSFVKAGARVVISGRDNDKARAIMHRCYSRDWILSSTVPASSTMPRPRKPPMSNGCRR